MSVMKTFYAPVSHVLPKKLLAFSHDVTSAILVFQNNQTADILVFQTSPVGAEPFSYVKLSFVPINLLGCLSRHRKSFIGEENDVS